MSTVRVRNTEIGAGVPKICVPIVGVTKDEILEMAEKIQAVKPDVAEWRADWYEDIFNWKETEQCVRRLRAVLGEVPLLFTFRTSEEGGEKAMEEKAYVELNQNIARTRCVDLLDVELFTGDEYVLRMIDTAHEYGVKVIVSNHDFQKTPGRETIVSRLCKMQELGADIPKIAVMPQNKKDVLTLLAATEEMYSKHADRPIITMSMKSDGVISRLSGEVFGSALTFGAVGKTSAPGQIAVDKLRSVLEILHESL